MISGLQTALRNAIDVIAPPATPIQDFTYHWKQLMNFYVSHLNDSKVSVEKTSIPKHLDYLLKLLLEEEKNGDEPGPCLEYMLQHRLLDLLATLASAETPPGMRLVCLSFLRRLLTRSKHPLLHHAAIYGSVQRMIAMCNGNLASPIENEEIQFLLSLCFLVCKYPNVTNIVNDSSNIPQESDLCHCDKSEIDQVTYIPVNEMKNANLLFKPLNTQAITLMNPDLFKTGNIRVFESFKFSIYIESFFKLSSAHFLNSNHRSFDINSMNKSSSQSEGFQENKQSKDPQNLQSTCNSSSQSSRSSRDVETISESSSPAIQKTNENSQTNAVSEVDDETRENLYKVSEDIETLKYDPVLTPLSNDFKDLRINEETTSSNTDIKSIVSKHDITFSDSRTPEHSKSLLLDSLKSYVNSPDNTIRIRACEGIMVLASLDDPFFAEVVAKSDLASILSKRLEILFNLIPAQVEPSDIEDIEVTWGLDSPPFMNEKKFPGCRRVAAFFMWMDFCAQLSREAHPEVAETLAQTIRITFFEKVLTPALSAHHAVLITTIITKCLKNIPTSPLSVEIGRWLVGRQREPDIADVWSCPVIHRLIENCFTDSDELTTETLKLFEAMIEKRDEHMLHCLVLTYLNTRGYYDNSAADSAIASWSDEEDEREREKKGSMDISQGMSHSRTLAPSNIHRILNCFLSLLPRQLQIESDSNYGRYVGNWEEQYSKIVRNCALLAWPLEAVTLDDCASSDSKPEHDSCSSRFYPGPFLSMLLEKVSSIPKQKYEINLHLTILITKLALLPHPYLHEYLLNPLIPLTPGNKSLFICLQRLVKQLLNDVPKIQNYKQILKELRSEMYDICCDQNKAATTARSKEDDLLLESVVILEEFFKELAAIAYVKYHHSS